ncbi:MAG: DUF4445 domain-containing protein [FCB group bacterium]|nr:DUF4445 domain-containing protein [FCB group bacterium]
MPYTVKIQPHDLELTAEAGDNLLEVIQRAGIPIEAECGGQGTCDRCAAIIIEGECLKGGRIADEGVILTCQAEVSADIMVRVSGAFKPAESKSSIVSGTPAAIIPRDKISPLTRQINLDLSVAEAGENVSDFGVVARALAPEGGLSAGLTVLQNLPQALRREKGIITATVSEAGGERKLIGIDGGRPSGNYGIACDVGTTTVALHLLDLTDGRLIGTASGYNRQIQCGADVISRILYSQKGGRLGDLQERIISTINRLSGELCNSNGIEAGEITAAVFAGNTTMTHLLLGIDPSNIREAPYTPAVKIVPLLRAAELGIEINSEGMVLCCPGAGSYVGGDISSGLLSIEVFQQPQGVSLFMDIGTNGELVVFADGWAAGCACSAGPAFEGVGISCGMRAAEGAVDSVKIDPGKRKVDYHVIGGGTAGGICGSGLLELTAGLFKCGVIGKDGKFTNTVFSDRINQVDNRNCFIVVEADAESGQRDISITEQDINNIMRAKAAVFSGCSLLLKNLGLAISDLNHIFIGGGFGKNLNIEHAIEIGMLPDIQRDKFTYLGNTSLAGAYLALMSEDHRKQLDRIAKSLTYIDLSSEPDYMSEYIAALFLPHTDIELFPSQL